MEANIAARAEGIEVWPQVSCRPLTFQMNLREPFTFNMRPAFQELMDRPDDERIAAYRDPAWRARAWDELSGRAGKRALPMNFDSLLVAETRDASRAHGPQRHRRRRRARLHAVRRHARPLARGEPRDALHERARQQRSRSDRVAAPAGHRAARARRLRRAREPALRRVLRDRPPRQLGARQGGHAARARDPQAHRRAGRRVRAATTAARSRSARPPTSWCSTSTRVGPGPLRRIRDFPADGERLVADQPVACAT